MARTKKAVKDSTAKQTNTAKQNIKGINTPPIEETLLKSHSMTSQKEIKARSYKNVGRPAVNIDYDKLEGFASQNIENYKIAEALGISTATFYKYMKEDERFKAAYEQGMENRKYELEKALYKRATGFEVQEVVTEKDETGNITKTKITDKMYVPDTTALIFTLSNRYGDRYKQKVESTLDININYNEIQQLSNDELVKLASNTVEAEYQIE